MNQSGFMERSVLVENIRIARAKQQKNELAEPAEISTISTKRSTVPLKSFNAIPHTYSYMLMCSSRLVKKIAPEEVKAIYRNPTRMRALREIENCLSLAAVAGAACQDIEPELFFNSDDVSVFVSDNFNERIKVVSTKKTLAYLRTRNLSPGNQLVFF